MIKWIYISLDNLTRLAYLTKLEILLTRELMRFLEVEGEFKDCILLSTSIRKKISEELNIKQSSFNNSISNLCKKEILYRLETSLYKVNNEIFKY